jgi:hypothetical protein
VLNKIIFVSLLFAFCFLFSARISSAHLLGQPPFFKVNGEYSVFYSVQSYSTYGDSIPPQDISLGRYLVNQPISFELEKSQLETIIPPEIVSKTQFNWDFDDGFGGRGFTNTHTYSKPGSYILTIYADTRAFEKGVEPQLLQSVFFNVYPDKNYQGPTAVIEVNGKIIEKDVTTNVTQDVFEVDRRNAVLFDGSKSIARSSSIVSYTWDFGDGQKAEGQRVEHTYSSSFDFVPPSLRIVDEKGFMSEVSVGLKESAGETSTFQVKQSQSIPELSSNTAVSFALVFLVVGICLVVVAKRR